MTIPKPVGVPAAATWLPVVGLITSTGLLSAQVLVAIE